MSKSDGVSRKDVYSSGASGQQSKFFVESGLLISCNLSSFLFCLYSMDIFYIFWSQNKQKPVVLFSIRLFSQFISVIYNILPDFCDQSLSMVACVPYMYSKCIIFCGFYKVNLSGVIIHSLKSDCCYIIQEYSPMSAKEDNSN